jgi:hypothetical protein
MADGDKTEATEPEAAEAPTAEQAALEDPNREGVIAALRRERAGYALRKLDNRVEGVDAELQRLGAGEEVAPQPAPHETAVESKPRRIAGRAKQGE